MRILFINLNQSAAYGGVERWMMDAASGLGARGHHCLLLGRPHAPWVAVARRMGLAVRDDHRGPWAERVIRVRAAMRVERPDVVVVKAKKAARMAAWGRATGAGGRVALYFGLTHELDPSRWIDRFTWRRCVDAGIVVAHGAARWYAGQGFGPAEKLHTLWKGVDLARWQVPADEGARARAALGLGADDLVLGTVGRLAWQKGLGDLLAAVGLLRSRLPHLRVLVVGGGRDAPLVEAAAAAPELDGMVTLLGQRDDVPSLLAAMDIFVQPSRREVMVQTTLEAMAAGRPVISTATVGADEAIEHGVSGLLVPVEEPEAMAESILDLAGDPERRAALAAAARIRVAEHFTMERMVDRCEAIFHRVVGGRAASELAASPPNGGRAQLRGL